MTVTMLLYKHTAHDINRSMYGLLHMQWHQVGMPTVIGTVGGQTEHKLSSAD